MLNLYSKRKLRQEERLTNVTGHDSFGPSSFSHRIDGSRSHLRGNQKQRRNKETYDRLHIRPSGEEHCASYYNSAQSPAADKLSETDFASQASLLQTGINWLRSRIQTLMSSSPGGSNLINGLLSFVSPR